MSDDDFGLVQGSGNVFRDSGHPDAKLQQLPAILAARIIKALDEQKLILRRALSDAINRPILDTAEIGAAE